jgi:hypothetical protein
MIRHFKWHKKRDESLQHGFMRYSPLDDCSDRFGNCTHNKKQTHYHCIKEGCDKVYISTSDVQMHANYHRKDSAIIQEGFQRYRATEECGASYCAFFGQRTRTSTAGGRAVGSPSRTSPIWVSRSSTEEIPSVFSILL